MPCSAIFHLPCNRCASETLWTSVSSSVKWADTAHQRVSMILYVNTFEQCPAHQGPQQTVAMSVIATSEFEIRSHRGADFCREMGPCGRVGGTDGGR